MIKTISLTAAALALTAGALAPVPAAAQRYDHRDARAYDDAYHDGYNRGPRDDRDYRERTYRARRCSSGTTGTILGAIAGGLLGRSIDTRGDRTLGTVVGAGAGALAGNAVERSDNPRYCHR